MQFRKKPVVIEAVQWNGQPPHSVAKALDIGPETFNLPPWYREDIPPPLLEVFTLEGQMSASHGDWIIRGVKGEVYPCKPDIFEATYEPVEDGIRESFGT